MEQVVEFQETCHNLSSCCICPGVPPPSYVWSKGNALPVEICLCWMLATWLHPYFCKVAPPDRQMICPLLLDPFVGLYGIPRGVVTL